MSASYAPHPLGAQLIRLSGAAAWAVLRWAGQYSGLLCQGLQSSQCLEATDSGRPVLCTQTRFCEALIRPGLPLAALIKGQLRPSLGMWLPGWTQGGARLDLIPAGGAGLQPHFCHMPVACFKQ